MLVLHAHQVRENVCAPRAFLFYAIPQVFSVSDETGRLFDQSRFMSNMGNHTETAHVRGESLEVPFSHKRIPFQVSAKRRRPTGAREELSVLQIVACHRCPAQRAGV